MSSTAAARVFAIPELLEMVLLQLSENEYDECWGWTILPATTLFSLKRVNKPFEAVIDGSTQLQRLMGLSHRKDESSDSISESEHYTHADWLLRRFFIGRKVSDPWGPDFVERGIRGLELEAVRVNEALQYDYYPFITRCFDEIHGETEASWREMLVSPFANAAPLKLSVMLSFGGGKYTYELVTVSWLLNAGDKLGDLFSLWSQLFDVLDEELGLVVKLKMGDSVEDKELYSQAARRVGTMQFSR